MIGAACLIPKTTEPSSRFHRVGELLARHILQPARRGPAGVVEQAVEAAERLGRGGDRRGDVGFLRHVRLHEAGAAAHPFGDGLARFHVAAGQHDLGPVLDEDLDRRFTDAAGAPVISATLPSSRPAMPSSI
jgi:hypothetical protein